MRLPAFPLLIATALVLAGCTGGEQESSGSEGQGDAIGEGELSSNLTVVDNSSTKETTTGVGNSSTSG